MSINELQDAFEIGFAKVAGIGKQEILAGIEAALKKKLPEKSPFGDGRAAEITAEAIKNELAVA